MSCPNCDRMAREARELREELAEWRRQGRWFDGEARDLTRVHDVQRRLRCQPALARLVLFLLERSPLLCTRAQALRVVAKGEETEGKVVDVQLNRLRAALKAYGFPGAVTTVWGQGWLIATDQAAPLRAFLGLEEDIA